MSTENLVLVCGKSASGKSISLMNIANPTGVVYLSCEHKKLPFKSEFREYSVLDPYQIFSAFDSAEEDPDIHTIIIDSLTYMMDMFETLHVLPSTNGLKAWGDYAQFFKKLMSHYVAKSTKNVIFTAHTLDVLNEGEMINETLVKVKGSLMNQGIESYFSTVIGAKKVTLKKLEKYGSDLLNITEEEKMLGFKYVFQTKLTKETVNERLRSSIGMWSNEETYIDNDVQQVINKLNEYYS